MTDIYAQFDAAFARVSAWLILSSNGDVVAKVAIKFPQDGAGRLYAYTHFMGLAMTRGHAGGYGYDKASPAVQLGFNKVAGPKDDPEKLAALQAFRIALNSRDGYRWDQNLEAAGYRVVQAV